MKKSILIFATLLLCISGFSQQYNLMNAVSATTTVTSYTVDARPQVGQTAEGITGTLYIWTSSAFNGTTSTDSLFESPDGIVWSPVLADDNLTVVRWTLSAGTNITKKWKSKSSTPPFIKVKYDKGNATLGTVNAKLFLR